MSLQGARYSIPYFVNPKLNYIIEGPEKRFSPVTGFDLLSKTGNAYAARKNGAVQSLMRQTVSNLLDDMSPPSAALCRVAYVACHPILCAGPDHLD